MVLSPTRSFQAAGTRTDPPVSDPIAAAAEGLYLIGQANGQAAADDSSVIRVVAPSRRQKA